MYFKVYCCKMLCISFRMLDSIVLVFLLTLAVLFLILILKVCTCVTNLSKMFQQLRYHAMLLCCDVHYFSCHLPSVCNLAASHIFSLCVCAYHYLGEFSFQAVFQAVLFGLDTRAHNVWHRYLHVWKCLAMHKYRLWKRL